MPNFRKLHRPFLGLRFPLDIMAMHETFMACLVAVEPQQVIRSVGTGITLCP